MSDILNIIEDFKKGCDCGRKHETAIRDIRIGSGLVNEVGSILTENNFPKNLLLVADQNTLKAAEGIVESLEGFNIKTVIVYDVDIDMDLSSLILILETIRHECICIDDTVYEV